MRHAASYWRGLSKEGKPLTRGLLHQLRRGPQGSVGQGNYSAAKAGIAAMTLVAAADWAAMVSRSMRSRDRPGPG